MEHFKDFLEVIILIIELFSIAILIYGVAGSLIHFIKGRFKVKTHEQVFSETRTLRLTLGVYILYSLEVLIVADIIATIIKPTTNDLTILAFIIVIRTVISVFLERELKE